MTKRRLRIDWLSFVPRHRNWRKPAVAYRGGVALNLYFGVLLISLGAQP